MGVGTTRRPTITDVLPRAEPVEGEPSRPAGRPAPGLFTRSRDDRVIAGVAGGLAERLGIDPMFLRVGLVVLASAAGVGLVGYLLAWVVSAEPADDAPPKPRPPAPSILQTAGFACILVGALVLLRALGLWLADAITWPLALAALGSAVLWTHGDERDRERWARVAARIPGDPVRTVFRGRAALARLAAGGLLVVAGLAAFLAAGGGLPLGSLGPVLAGMLVAAVGLGVLLAPWGWQLARQLSEERVARVRSQERAELAAHLHDSVLQTLALIQRSDDPREMATLARTQERDLRAWLYGTGGVAGNLRAAVEEAAASVEARTHVPIEVVVVGDSPLDERLHALVQAAAEAMSNAARHAQADRVTVYAEVEDEHVDVFVTDQGVGFDPAAVPPDRRGLAESVRGRMRRNGGQATIRSEPGEGTEVELHMPRRQP